MRLFRRENIGDRAAVQRGGETVISQGKEAKSRKRIAFMLASVHSGASTKVWPEILHESEKHPCTLFVFPGGRLAGNDGYEYMRNGIFRLVGSRSFDGAISWSSSLSGFASEKQVETFLLDQVDIPLVTFGLKIGEKPVVNIDAYSGMKQLVFHLIKRHKRRKLAFLGGPREHSSAEDRFRAYRDALEESNIRFDERLVSLDNSWTEGRKAISSLLDGARLKPGDDFDALCAASDLLAFEAAKLLQERGYHIPADVALGGFNDSDESNLFSPTYTTVHMPFDRQAVQAFHMLLDLLEGKKPTDRALKTKLVIRQSCGCMTESVRMAGQASSLARKGRARPGAGSLVGEVIPFISGFAGFSAEEGGRYLEPIVSSFLGARAKGGKGKNFLDALDAILNEFIFRDCDIAVFQDVLSAIRIACRDPRESRSSALAFETLLGQGRVLISDAEKRTSNYRVWKEKSVDHWLNILSHELLCTKNFQAIVEVAGRWLPKLNIPSGYFVLNGKDTDRKIFAGGFDASGGREGSARIMEARDGRGFPSDLILPEEVTPCGKAAYIVLPLYYESTSLGYMVLQLQGNDASIFEEIRAQISSAMRGVLLFEQVDEARKRAEKAEKMKTEFLAGISGELQEPIGFIFRTANRLLEEGGEDHKADIEAIVAYSGRHMELIKHLLDLSLAEVDDFAFAATSFDPLAFARHYAAEAAVHQGRKPWGRITLAEPAGALPLVLGDKARIRQVLELFLDCLFRELSMKAVDIRVELCASGVSFSLSGDLNTEGAAEKASTLRAVLNSGAGLASLDRMKIELELAKRIAFLHGGGVGCGGGENRFGLSLILPYPSIEGAPPRDSAEKQNAPIGLFCGELPPSLGAVFPNSPLRRFGIAEAGSSKVPPEEFALLYLDPASMPPESAVAVRLFLENNGSRRTGLFVEASGIPDGIADKSASLGDLLPSLLPPKTANATFALGFGGSDETADLASTFLAEGRKLFRCETPEELGLLARKESPLLLVLAGQRIDFIEAAESIPSLANIPLLCVAGKFNDPAFKLRIADRPRTVLCNLGAVFGDLIASDIDRILRGDELLPAPTGALIMDAVIFLNKYFREQISRWKLSEYVNASEDYLSRIFHRQMGIPLWEYLNRLRVGYAIGLLKTSAESVAEIASRSGFQDQAYFCRVFKRIAGSTPGAVRKESGANVRKVQ